MTSMGFHWMAVDMEHPAISTETATLAFLAAERHGCVPLVRLASADAHAARGHLDNGAQGYIVPAVEDAVAFEEFVHATLYKPAGTRGVSLGRHNTWGAGTRFRDDLSTFRPFVVPMIETTAAIDALDAITALPFIDAIFIGPWDLSADLGDGGNFETAAFTDAIGRIRNACARNDVPLGIHVAHPEDGKLQEAIDDGFRFIAYGTDMLAMRHALKTAQPFLED